jgi:hypothetical protein
MLEQYKVKSISGNLRLRVEPVGAIKTPVNEIKLVKRDEGKSGVGSEETDARKATIYLWQSQFDAARAEIREGDLVSYKSSSDGPTHESLKSFWF